KGYIDVIPDPIRAQAEGVALDDVQRVVGMATSGRVVSRIDDGMTTRSVRIKLPDSTNEPNDALFELRVPVRQVTAPDDVRKTPTGNSFETIPLAAVADIRVSDGPATIKSENGWLRNYVRLNVRDRPPADFVAAAQQHVQQTFVLPPGVFLEWTGQF